MVAAYTGEIPSVSEQPPVKNEVIVERIQTMSVGLPLAFHTTSCNEHQLVAHLTDH